jgi:hypothetical protein
LLAAYLSELLALTSILSGAVVDPQDLPVPGARVELVCGTQRDSVETDERGRFTIATPPASRGCRLLVAHQGFAPYEQDVGTSTEVIRIALRIADLSQQVSVVAEEPSARSVGSVVLSGADLRTFAGTTADLVRYARLLAGGTTLPGVIYVDGLPATELPALSTIASISVNADPFAPERADGDVASIEIRTRSPARTLRFHLGSDVLEFGGGDALAPDARSGSAFQNFGVAGPVPRFPLTFAANMSLGRMSREMPILAVVPGADASPETARSRDGTWGGTLSLHYAPDAPFKARVSYRESHADSVNLGVGGIVLPEAGSSASFVTREARMTTTTAVGARLLYEGSLLVARRRWDTRANSEGAGIMIPGDVVMGGAPTTSGRTRNTRWTSNHVLRGTSKAPWSAGVTVSGTGDLDEQAPNPGGLFEFADLAAYTRGLAGEGTATWFVTRGDSSARRASVRIAPFIQKALLSLNHLEIVAGVRADFQTRLGALVSPRLSLAAAWRGLYVRAGTGLFVKEVPGALFITALKNDGQHLQQYMVADAALAGPTGPAISVGTSVRSAMSPDITPPREFMARVSVERPVGRLTPGMEYTWSQGRHLLGSERRADGAGWLDLFQSNRAAERHRLHAQVQYARKGQLLSVQYEWTHSRDNTNGPFCFVEQPGNLAAEWARSIGVPPHSVTTMGMFTLPGQVSLSVTHTWRSTAPYDITTGLDAAGNGLFLDRGGRMRNSGDGPDYSSLDAYAYRRVQLPNVLRKASWRMRVNIGVQAQNLLNRRNLMGIGSVAGAANFGKPIAAYSGRSIKLSLNFD